LKLTVKCNLRLFLTHWIVNAFYVFASPNQAIEEKSEDTELEMCDTETSDVCKEKPDKESNKATTDDGEKEEKMEVEVEEADKKSEEEDLEEEQTTQGKKQTWN